ncbi:MAG: DUF2177 family protein [Caulobacterales bacterium]|jgi:uncharacterized membrane protein|nr:DUF2177 family protein [Caulobacterales bacterium]
MSYLIAWISTGLVFAIADAIWLSQAVPRVYKPMIGELLRPDISWPAAIAFYFIYVCGIVYFAVAPALAKQSLSVAFINGALLGMIAYATYDLTNQATLKIWDWRLTLIDMAWGACATALAASASYWLAQRFAS